MSGFEGLITSTPLAVDHFNPGQAVLILVSSRRHFFRKLSTVTRSFDLAGDRPIIRRRRAGRRERLF